MRGFLLPLLATATMSRASAIPSDTSSSKRAVGSWDDAYTKATAALAKLSQNDKIGIVTGVGWQGGNCVGNTKAASSIGYPSLCLQDGPLGVRYVQGVTAFAAGIHAASTWDVNLVRERGAFLGAESKQLGVHVQLGPSAGPLGKFAQGGRNWEGFGSDPYLQGIMMAQTIEGMQESGVQATAKHFILNEQELNRETMSADLYVWPFMDAIKSNVAAFMCSYNKINGAWACENDGIMNKLLKDELGFRGYIMSDWNAQHTTLGSANGGLDMTMPGTDFEKKNVYWGPQLQSAINNRQVQQSRLDDMVKRILAAWYLLGQDKNYPTATFNSWKIGSRDVGGNHKTNARAMARDGIVLLKNTNSVLPFNKPKSIAVIGSDSIVAPKGANACVDRGCNDGTLAMGWGSGSVEFPYLIAPLDAIKAQAQKDSTTITSSPNDNAQQGASAAQNADIAVVCINSAGGEGYITVEGNAGDRKNLDPWHNGNELVKAVAAVNKKTVVVVHSVGPVIMEPWIDNPNVVAVVWAGLPGQESGNGLVDILYGAASPSGKLPYTIAKRPEDYGTAIARGNDAAWDLFVDYRHFDKQNIAPRFEFGFGLSYTNFTYSDLGVSGAPTAGLATGAKGPGGPADLWETVATVTAKVANSGGVAGAEVPQLYLGYPAAASTPSKQLRGFAKLKLEAGASGTATFKLRRRDLSIWDEKTKQWSVVSGEYGVFVGSSSRDVSLPSRYRTLTFIHPSPLNMLPQIMKPSTIRSASVLGQITKNRVQARYLATVQSNTARDIPKPQRKATPISHERATFTIKNGPIFTGKSFGAKTNISGEAVFTTSLVGYPESMSDPSYRGQILVFTQPLIGNYGVPSAARDEHGLLRYFESPNIQASGIVVQDYALKHSHWTAVESLAEWCAREGVPAISGVDTREVVTYLREQGSSLARITIGEEYDADEDEAYVDPEAINLVRRVSTKAPFHVSSSLGDMHVALLDCGVKENILRSLVTRGASVTCFPFDYPIHKVAHHFDGVFISNGPGDPTHCTSTVYNLRKLFETSQIPVMGICMGHQLIALAAGAKTIKLKYGNRAHNIPALDLTTGKCHITSQNHGYAVDPTTLSSDWREYFTNLNDQSNEGLIHNSRPIFSAQFHPEAKGGPLDSAYLFDKYIENVQQYKDHQATFSDRNNKPSPLLVDLLSKERVGVHPDAPDVDGHAGGQVRHEVVIDGPVAPPYQPITQKPVAAAA
ncbi:glycoside hydrolase family 3 protein [Cucurbitaria berberidis CBS 394.84]|uniref:Carbamoyl phosphate synthase arginine-specific small chain n=1 Tax=Cucurbitaria berberidis CBS 394.84 TaxID=1168544 RepID=A0A9P4GLP3_9PLEO|nr:glycoside hydrolase family 3 protein [Cucurbitaria berberidis CBS 394.84]KAF1847527.1 glycoside hydrolase family 3 protein [Cucurbitaria berberidis CBS 394.84]